MKWVDLGIVALLAVAAPACGDDGRMMSNYARDLDGHVEMLEREQEGHFAVVNEAVDFEAVRRAENDHERQMADHIGMMDGATGGMMACGNASAGTVDTAPFARMMQELQAEHAGHMKEMMGATDLLNAKLIELMHQRAMQERLATMRRDLRTMTGSAMGYHCNP